MKINKKQRIIEDGLILFLVFIVTVSMTKVITGFVEDRVTKNTCNALNGVYVVGANIGQSYCDNK